MGLEAEEEEEEEVVRAKVGSEVGLVPLLGVAFGLEFETRS